MSAPRREKKRRGKKAGVPMAKETGGKMMAPKIAKPSTQREARRRKEMAASYFATKMQQAAGGQGKDSRSPSLAVEKNGVNSQVMKSQQATIPIKASVRDEAVWYLALAPVSLALQKGWISEDVDFTPVAQKAYDAFCYLCSAFFTVMQGSYPTMQSAPRWFWEITAALMPCTTKFKTGNLNYAWDVSGSLPPVKLPLSGNTFYYFGQPGGTTTDGFTDLEPVAAYDPARGAAAISSLFKFMNAKGMAEVIPKPETRFLDDDSSTFAATYPEWGSTFATTGALALTLQHEVKVACPILSKFAAYQQSDNWRGFQEARKCAGTSSYIIPRSLEFFREAEFRNKASPVFKFYNFDEYFLTLSYILGQASEALVTDNSLSDIPLCPLTSQQVQILLRQSILSRFCNIYAQDLMSTSFNTGYSLIPFCCGPNGNPVSGSQAMKLPFVFVENIRSATRRTINVGGAKEYVIDALPILSRPPLVPQLDNFEWTNRGSVITPLYKIDATEVPIDLIDLSTSNHLNFVTITGEPLTDLITEWNTYIVKLGNALSSLCTIGEEPGITALLTTFNTRHVTEFTPPSAATNPPIGAQMVKQPSVKKIAKGNSVPKRAIVGKARPVGGSDAYTRFNALRLTSSDPLYSSLWRYEAAFVQPCTISATIPSLDSTVSFQQVFQIEPFSVPYSDISPYALGTAQAQISLDALSYAAATLDIKTNLSSPSEAETELASLAVAGRGGFFTSLAGAIGEGLGIPGAKEIADTVGVITGL